MKCNTECITAYKYAITEHNTLLILTLGCLAALSRHINYNIITLYRTVYPPNITPNTTRYRERQRAESMIKLWVRIAIRIERTIETLYGHNTTHFYRSLCVGPTTVWAPIAESRLCPYYIVLVATSLMQLRSTNRGTYTRIEILLPFCRTHNYTYAGTRDISLFSIITF